MSATAVVLAPKQQSLHERLRSLLEARDWRAVELHDPLLAMAELCWRRKGDELRAARGIGDRESIELVVSDPRAWPEAHVEALRHAMARYLPEAGLWTFTDGRLIPLNAPQSPANAPDAAPDDELPADPVHVTSEEIEMLLEADLTSAESPRGGRDLPS